MLKANKLSNNFPKGLKSSAPISEEKVDMISFHFIPKYIRFFYKPVFHSEAFERPPTHTRKTFCKKWQNWHKLAADYMHLYVAI